MQNEKLQSLFSHFAFRLPFAFRIHFAFCILHSAFLMSGHLIAFEGLDQSGKQTQAERLRDRLKAEGHKSRLVSFPDYGTSIGEELARALQANATTDPK
jgi:hypothetical protein